MTYLPDVNVWVAWTIREHIHHAAATAWLNSQGEDIIAFCRVTQMGFLRLLTNPHVMASDALTASRAWSTVDAYLKDSRFRIVPEPAGLEQHWRIASNRARSGPNFWTDAYLRAFGRAAGYTLVTFDKGFRQHRDCQMQILE